MTEEARSHREQAVRRVLLLVLWMNLGLIGLKLGIWAFAHALSVLAEVFHSSLDAANNVFALVLARVAARGPDAEHPYGHRKFETIGALALVGVLSVTVFELTQHALIRVSTGQGLPDTVNPWAIGLMAFSALVGLAIARYEARIGRRLRSHLVLADAAHTQADVLATVAVLVGLVAVRAGYPLADPLAAIVVAMLIAYTGWAIVRETVPVLVDHRAVDPLEIEALAMGVAGVRSAYGIRSRGPRGERFAELTISVDPALDVVSSHAIADATEERISLALGARDVVVHVEPHE